jgi:hypothetical protein
VPVHEPGCPAAVLSGVFKLNNLRSAQSANLTIFWAHNLDAMVGIEGFEPSTHSI